MQNRIKLIDIFIILIAAAFIFFTAHRAYISPQENPHVLIRGQEGEWIYPVGTDETISVKGPLGDTVVRLSVSGAWVDSSPCDNQNCVASGKINRHGQWAACLPNNVILLIQSAGENDVDSVSW